MLDTNEIRNYIARAPRRISFNGGWIVNTTHVRFKWLADIAHGTINCKINRRAGVVEEWRPWKYPVGSAIRRNRRNCLRILGKRDYTA